MVFLISYNLFSSCAWPDLDTVVSLDRHVLQLCIPDPAYRLKFALKTTIDRTSCNMLVVIEKV
jgi:hypothetical protein